MWKLSSAHLEPHFLSTNVLEALLLASQIFNRQLSEKERKVLVRFSDMRDYPRDFDLELSKTVSALRSARKILGVVSIDLHQLQVYALGVDGAGMSTDYWQGLKRFWARFFQEPGATLDSFSVLGSCPYPRIDSRLDDLPQLSRQSLAIDSQTSISPEF